MLKCSNLQAAKIIRELAEGGVEPDWQAGIDKILARCDAAPSDAFPLDGLYLSNFSGLPLEVCDSIVSAILNS